jgi:tetratricopeptide (TPR) repeat protein
MLDLDGRTIALVGRLHAVPRRLAVEEAERRGATVRRGLPRRTELVVIGGGARSLLAGGRLIATLALADELGARALSEKTFLRALGLIPPAGAEPAEIPLEQLGQSVGLEPAIVRLMELFDLIEARDGRCSFRDLVTGREVARLLRENVSFGEILDVIGMINRREPVSHPLARHKLVCAEDGRLVVRLGERLAELDGQLCLALPEAGNPSLDLLFEAAEEAEDEGDLAAAEVLYRRCVDLDRRDPIIAFNLANVLREQGSNREAKWYLQLALAHDPGFAEAWYNLAMILHAEGEGLVVREHLERAIAADPEYSDPVYNLARWHAKAGDPVAAARWWERYLELDPDSEWARKARRALALCRGHVKEVK